MLISDLEKIYALSESEAKPVEGPGDTTLSWMKNNKIIVLAGNIKIIDLESNKVGEIRKKFGFEPEFTIKTAKMGMRIYEVGISYSGRSYAEGKKINWKDGLWTMWCLIKYSLVI